MCKFKLLLCILAFVCFNITAAFGTTYYVNINDANSTPTGTSWESAFDNINDAVDVASDGDEIWVAGGTYEMPDAGHSGVHGAGLIQLYIDKELSLYGGFSGDETLLEQRDWARNNTILDSGTPSTREFFIFLDDEAVIDGFVLTNANAPSGAIYIDEVTAEIRNCVFFNNTAKDFGGAIYNSGANTVVENCVFSKNRQTLNQSGGIHSGGAILCRNSGMRITNCTFFANSAVRGGAISCVPFNGSGEPTASISIQNSIIFGNESVLTGDNLYINNLGLSGYSSSVSLANCYLDNGISTLSNGSYSSSNSIINGTDPGFNISSSYTYSTITETLLKGASGSNWMTCDNGLMLSGSSTCIDAGDDDYVDGTVYTITTDITGDDRIDAPNNGVDIGAYEYRDVIYVDVNSPDITKDGSCWARAYASINDAVDVASDGYEIWVAGGTYEMPDAGHSGVHGAGLIQLYIDKELSLYGGFSGDETLLEQRDWGANNTVLDSNSPSTREFFIFLDDEVVIDGFVLTNANAPSGAIYIDEVTAEIRNCVFFNNTAKDFGGAIYNSGANTVVENCVFAKNRQTLNQSGGVHSGGAILCRNSGMRITNCTFFANSAVRGGAISCVPFNGSGEPTASISIQNSIIFGNESSLSGNNLYINNLGLSGYSSSVSLVNCYLDGGISTLSGGSYSTSDTTTNGTDPGFNIAASYTYSTVTETLLKGTSASNWMTYNDGLSLGSSSGCIDTGDEDYVDGTVYTIETDITGADRIDDPNNGVDIGAYEYYGN